MESKHTKGEWEILGKTIVRGVGKGNKHIAQCFVQNNYKPITFEPIEDTEANDNAKRIVHCVNSYDELVKQNEMLKKALNTILNLGRPNGDYAAAFSKTKTIANNALNTLTVKEDGNNEAKAL